MSKIPPAGRPAPRHSALRARTSPFHYGSLLLGLALLGLGLAAPAHAQYALRADVVAAGATDAAGGAYRLRATAGQPATGRVAGGAYALGQGFWYPATTGGGSGPALSVTATPLNPPITIPAGGGEFRFRVTITNNTGSPQTFQAWITVTLPNGNPYHVLGPQSLTLGPNQTFGPVTLRQQIPASAPAGGYVHHVHVGTFPNNPVATGSFPWTKSAAPLAREGDVLALSAREQEARRAASASRAGARATDGGAREAAGAERATDPARRNAARASLAARGGGAARVAGWLVLLDATGAPVGEGEDLALAMPIDEAAEARITAEEAVREAVAEEAAEEAAEARTAATTPEPAVGAHAAEVPAVVTLAPPFPNPFGGSGRSARTTLRFALPAAGAVRLAVYDVTGRRVALLADETREAGWHEAVLDGGTLASGVYVVRLEAGGRALTRRLTLVR